MVKFFDFTRLSKYIKIHQICFLKLVFPRMKKKSVKIFDFIRSSKFIKIHKMCFLILVFHRMKKKFHSIHLDQKKIASLSKHIGSRRKKSCVYQAGAWVPKRAAMSVKNQPSHSLTPQNHSAITRQIVLHQNHGIVSAILYPQEIFKTPNHFHSFLSLFFFLIHVLQTL